MFLDGRNIKFTEMTAAVRTSFNFAQTFCIFVPTFMAGVLLKNYKTVCAQTCAVNAKPFAHPPLVG
jgi:hypothetical protein